MKVTINDLTTFEYKQGSALPQKGDYVRFDTSQDFEEGYVKEIIWWFKKDDIEIKIVLQKNK